MPACNGHSQGSCAYCPYGCNLTHPVRKELRRKSPFATATEVPQVVFEVIPDSDRVTLDERSRSLLVSPKHASTEVRFSVFRSCQRRYLSDLDPIDAEEPLDPGT